MADFLEASAGVVTGIPQGWSSIAFVGTYIGSFGRLNGFSAQSVLRRVADSRAANFFPTWTLGQGAKLQLWIAPEDVFILNAGRAAEAMGSGA